MNANQKMGVMLLLAAFLTGATFGSLAMAVILQ